MWMLIIIWSHFSDLSPNNTTITGLQSQHMCEVVAQEQIKAIHPWNVKYKCVEIK